MKFVQLHYRDRELFDAKLDVSDYVFFHSHRDAFRQMIKQQGKDFWIRFMLTFRTASTKFGVVRRLFSSKCSRNCRENHVVKEDMVDWFFIQLHNILIEGTVGDCKQLIDDVALIAQNQHVFRNVFCKSFSKDPFYMPSTRDAFRRLFGNQIEKVSYMRIVMFPLYETFACSLCRCLRRWVDALEMHDPSDQSYWVQPTNSTPDEELDNDVDEQFSVHFIKLALALARERSCGSPKGPVFVPGWPKETDPRYNDPFNPLYNPKAKRVSDWRNDLEMDRFVKFIIYCQEKGNASSEDETVRSELNGKIKRCAEGGYDSPDSAEVSGIFSEELDILKSDLNKNEKVNNQDVDREAADKLSRTSKTAVKKAKVRARAHDSLYEKNNSHKFNGCSTKRTDSEQVKLTGPQEAKNPDDVAPDEGESLTISAEASVAKRFSEALSMDTRSVDDGNKLTVLSRSSHLTIDDGRLSEKVEGVNVSVKMDSSSAGSQISSSMAPTENHDATSGRVRVCSNCLRLETRPHEFKKCKKCKDMKLQNAKYYCGRECQVADWDKRHRMEHRTTKLGVVNVDAAFSIGVGSN